MSDFERRKPRGMVNVSEEFSRMSLGEFLTFIRNKADTTLTVKVDIAKKPLEYRALQDLLSESHISHFTIQATEKEHDDNASLFTIAGVDWEPKE